VTDDIPAPPRHLSESSAALWKAIVEPFDLKEQHLVQLRLGLEAVDRCDQARRILAKDGLVITGQRGSLMRHPMVDVEIQSRTAALRAFHQLGLDSYIDPGNPNRDKKGRFS
jgi:phage terminase small subunit